METASSDLVVRILRNSLAGAPGRSLAVGSGWGSACAVWIDDEWTGDGCQCWNHAGCRITFHAASREPHVAGSDIEHPAAISGRPSAARTLQRRRSRDALRGHPHYCYDFLTSGPQNGGRTSLHKAWMDSPRPDRSCDLPWQNSAFVAAPKRPNHSFRLLSRSSAAATPSETVPYYVALRACR
jgi:hypothetical protein